MRNSTALAKLFQLLTLTVSACETRCRRSELVVRFSIDFVFLIACALLQVKPGIILESPNQKNRIFLVQIKLTPCSLVHTHKMFGEMSVRTRATF
jgi:hypothetical protein